MPSKTDDSRRGEQTIEQLQGRYSALNERKITAQANLITSQKNLADLQRQAREKYGTDDIAELQQKLKTMTEENEAKRSQYQMDLDQIEADLARVEQKFAASEASTSEEAKS